MTLKNLLKTAFAAAFLVANSGLTADAAKVETISTTNQQKVVTTNNTSKTRVKHKAIRSRRRARNASRSYMINTIQQAARTK